MSNYCTSQQGPSIRRPNRQILSPSRLDETLNEKTSNYINYISSSSISAIWEIELIQNYIAVKYCSAWLLADLILFTEPDT